LRVTPGDHDASLRIFPVHPANGGARVLIGSSRNSTGIQDNYLGISDRWRTF
jgi:hypothetical protein